MRLKKCAHVVLWMLPGVTIGCGGNATNHPGDGGNGGTGGSGGAPGSGGQQMGAGGAEASGGGATGGTSSGGSLPSGVVAILGDTCSTPAALACAGNHQKVSLLCGASGTWEANETCGEGQFCDSSEGADAGTCRQTVAECEGLMPGDRFCRGSELMVCGPDLVTDEFQESCSDVGVCEGGACVEKDPCLDSGLNCDVDCRPLSSGCGGASLDEIEVISTNSLKEISIRTPAAARAGTCEGSERRYFVVLPDGSAHTPRVAAPWGFATGTTFEEFCSAPIQEGCMIFGPDQMIVLVAPDSSALPRNVIFEPGSTCE